jgi:hypothetical protein
MISSLWLPTDGPSVPSRRRRRGDAEGLCHGADEIRQQTTGDGVELTIGEHSPGSSVVGLAHDLLQLAGGYVAFVGGGRSKGIKTAIIAFTTRPPVTVSSSSSRSSRGSVLVLLMNLSPSIHRIAGVTTLAQRSRRHCEPGYVFSSRLITSPRMAKTERRNPTFCDWPSQAPPPTDGVPTLGLVARSLVPVAAPFA